MRRWFQSPLALGFCCFALANPVAADTRGISVDLRANETRNAPVSETVTLYRASHALVIGIDKYSNGWPKLSKAVEDARRVAAVLEDRGFSVTLRTDLTAFQLRSELRQFFAKKGSDPDARLLLWFAGHGHTIGGEGFLVPADAPATTNEADFLVSALHMRDFGGLMRLARSKHVLSIFDSCFSGTIFDARAGAPPPAITRKTTRPVRQFITSGDAGQQVRDDGSFREYFLRALSGEEKADFNGDGYVTGDELGLFLNQKVTTLTEAAQTPKIGKLHDVRFNRGDFVFKLARAARSVAKTTPASPKADPSMAIWNAIKDSQQAGDYETFLETYPNSPMAPFARRRLRTLSRTKVAAVTPPPKPQVELVPVEAAYVTTRNANVRAEPSVSAAKVATLPKGTEVYVPGKTKDGNWLRVERNSKTLGYVFVRLLRDKLEIEAARSVADGKSATQSNTNDVGNMNVGQKQQNAALSKLAVLLPPLKSLSVGSRRNLPSVVQREISNQDLVGRANATIYFEFDRWSIREIFFETITNLANKLASDKKLSAEIVGHTDARATREFQLGLSSVRANNVKSALIAKGVSPSQLETVAYGRERPVCAEANEVCWSMNRRVDIYLRQN